VVWTPFSEERLKWWEETSKEQSKAAETRVEKRGIKGRETRGREGSIARNHRPRIDRDLFGRILCGDQNCTYDEDQKSKVG